MVRQRDVQGKIYKIKSRTACKILGIPTPNFPRGHMVLVLDIVPGLAHHVKVMTITSSPVGDMHNYIPFAPVRKHPFPIQLQLQSHWTMGHREVATYIPALKYHSYLKINEYYEIHIQILDEIYDEDNFPVRILTKGKGGVGELRNYMRLRERRERVRAEDFHETMGRLTLE